MTKKVAVKKTPAKKPAPAKKVAAPKAAKKVAAPKPKAEKKPIKKYAKGEHPGSVAGVRAKADDIVKLGGTVARSSKTRALVDNLKLPASVESVQEQLKAAGIVSTSVAIRWYILRGYLDLTETNN